MLEWNKKTFQLSMGDFSEEYIRKVAMVFAVVGFFVHIVMWALFETGNITITGEASELVKSPLSTLYTPFSILLVYEVYQLIRTIPDSFSSSVGKQYEIATLLVVRDILKRLSEVENSEGWKISSDLGFLLVECAAFLVLLYTSLTYFRISSSSEKSEQMADNVAIFVEAKRGIANAMLLIFLAMAAYSFYTWVDSVQDGGGSVSRVIFFLDFFTFLILADILILLISYWFYTDFGNLARNTGFVLSTVIIRVAISSEGISSMILFTLSGLLGIAILRMFTPNNSKL
ncbi:hypothetical protein OAO74_04065 [Euryarchaeota archaeon]|jgi:uncharacterized membrane protein (DUF373 family)|nr:hypothetical protein [Euryarchaeota archaeon]